jgi:hypothetical protein
MPSGRSGQSIAGTIVLRIPHFGGTLAIISARFSTMPLTAGARLGASAATQIEVVVNWFEELKQRVPKLRLRN